MRLYRADKAEQRPTHGTERSQAQQGCNDVALADLPESPYEEELADEAVWEACKVDQCVQYMCTPWLSDSRSR